MSYRYFFWQNSNYDPLLFAFPFSSEGYKSSNQSSYTNLVVLEALD